jgi:GTP-binding protein
MIVSEVAGTTRDSVDVRFERDGKTFVAIDTAGVRRKQSLASDIEFYSLARAERSIRRADVVLHFFDPRLRISKVDKQLTEYILEHNKPAIFVVNKWDLAKDYMPTEKMANYIKAVFPMLDHVPIAFVTAKKGKNVFRLLNLAQQLHKQAGVRAGTSELNRVIRDAVEKNPPPIRYNRQAKIYYATQVDVYPPSVVLFTNGPELLDQTYQRYLLKALRDHFPFGEVAIKLSVRSKQGGKGGADEADTELDVLDAAPEPAPHTDLSLDEPAKPAEKPKPAKKAKKEADDDFERERKKYESELWNL